jgi:hypothetical protein
MKYLENKLRLYVLLVLSVLLLAPAIGQDKKQVKSRMSFDYYSVSGERMLKVVMKARIGKKYELLPDLELNFYIMSDTLSTLLGTASTTDEGVATMMISEDQFKNKSLNGLCTFECVFEGSDSFKPAKKVLNVKDLFLNLTFAQNEEKEIILSASDLFEDGEIQVEENIEIIFYVPRTFTLFRIGSKILSDGKAVIPFPVDLPGDTLGYMDVVAKVEDHDLYGNVEVSSSINWGLPQAKIVEKTRGLGDTDAPLWMVYTLIVLLSLVWFHYFYVLYSIYLIKKESRELILENQKS